MDTETPLVAEGSDLTVQSLERFSADRDLRNAIYMLAVHEIEGLDLKYESEPVTSFPEALSTDDVAAISVVAGAMVDVRIQDAKFKERHGRKLQLACISRLGRLAFSRGDTTTMQSAGEFLVNKGSRGTQKLGKLLLRAASADKREQP